MGVSIRFQNILPLCFHLKRSPIPSLAPQTSLDSPACPVLSHLAAFVSRSTVSSISSRPLHTVAAVRPSLLYLVSLDWKLTGQKMHWRERNHHKSIRKARAKGAWKTWQSAQSCQLCSWEAEVGGLPPFQSQPGQRNSLSQGGGYYLYSLLPE